jgi:hypothetical protein
MLGDWRRALEFRDLMASQGVRLDNPSLLSLVRVLEKAGQKDAAARVREARSKL